MVEKKNKEGIIVEYDFGDFSIHNHISNPENWVISYRFLGIYGEQLCSKELPLKEVLQAAFLRFGSEIIKLSASIDLLSDAQVILLGKSNELNT